MVNRCRRCGCVPNPTRMFCDGCGLILEPRSLRVHTPTDETRARALDEMHAGVEAGKAEFQRDVEERFERQVFEHYRSMFE